MSTEAIPRSLLVVDDNVDILRFVRETLGALANCTVDTTPSSEYAFELALRKSYGLFVFDFAMPNVDGATLYSFIRKAYQYDGRTPARRLPPLLLLSGNANDRRARELLREPGVVGLLPKPFTIDGLLGKIGACLPGSKPPPPEPAPNP